jgi:glycine/D-amino acid oxidase-like deaminating enzyme
MSRSADVAIVGAGVMGLAHAYAAARWVEALEQAKLPYWPEGSLHVVYRDDEAAVAREFSELAPGLGYECSWLNRDQALAQSHAFQADGLSGALWSATELTVDPRQVMAALPGFLRERFGVETYFGCAVHSIDLPLVRAGRSEWSVDQVIVCSGDDFETLYPDSFASSGLTRVKLQMLRTAP